MVNTAPPPGKVVVDVVTVNGSGCPGRTAAVAVSPDNTEFTVTYSGFPAPLTDVRKNCQVNLRIHVPQGFTYAIAEADYSGYASLAPGVTGSVRATRYFQGYPSPPPVTRTFTGPFEDGWQIVDRTDEDQLVFLPCGQERNFNINIELKVSAGPSFITLDPMDGSGGSIYRFAWKTCPAQ